MENALDEESDFRLRGELSKEIGTLRCEVKEMRDELKLKNIVLDKYETKLKRYMSAVFVENKFEGARKYSKVLIVYFWDVSGVRFPVL